jgi:hypothetical protein
MDFKFSKKKRDDSEEPKLDEAILEGEPLSDSDKSKKSKKFFILAMCLLAVPIALVFFFWDSHISPRIFNETPVKPKITLNTINRNTARRTSNFKRTEDPNPVGKNVPAVSKKEPLKTDMQSRIAKPHVQEIENTAGHRKLFGPDQATVNSYISKKQTIAKKKNDLVEEKLDLELLETSLKKTKLEGLKKIYEKDPDLLLLDEKSFKGASALEKIRNSKYGEKPKEQSDAFKFMPPPNLDGPQVKICSQNPDGSYEALVVIDGRYAVVREKETIGSYKVKKIEGNGVHFVVKGGKNDFFRPLIASVALHNEEITSRRYGNNQPPPSGGKSNYPGSSSKQNSNR